MKRVLLHNKAEKVSLAYEGSSAGALYGALAHAKTKGVISASEYEEVIFQYSRSRNDNQALQLIQEAMPHITLQVLALEGL